MWMLAASAWGQGPGITYQAILFDNQLLPGEDNRTAPLASQDVCLKFVFKDPSGINEYEEVISTRTDAFGMVNVIIGTGTPSGGASPTFGQIAWSDQAKFLEVFLDKSSSCRTYTLLSSQQFTAVPFALFAANSGNLVPQVLKAL